MKNQDKNESNAEAQAASLHTPTPWILEKHEGQGKLFINGLNGLAVAYVYGDSNKELEANAARIVHCVNNFDRIVKALEGLLPLAVHTSPQDIAISNARKALAEAEGGA